jgi:hypothetical protein
MLIEYLLSMGLLLPKQSWKTLLIAGVALHTGILLFHGLVSFSIAMFAALILYLRPVEQGFGFADRACGMGGQKMLHRLPLSAA